jgi:hypothetical protein
VSKRLGRARPLVVAAASLTATFLAVPATAASDPPIINPAPGAGLAPLDITIHGGWGQLPIPADFRPVSLPSFVGEPAAAAPVDVPLAPENPSLLPGHKNNLNNDSYRSNTSPEPGPVGRSMQVASTWEGLRECTASTVLTAKRLVTVCYSVIGPWLVQMDTKTLKRLSQYQLPARDATVTAASDFRPQLAGAGYYYVDRDGHVVMPTAMNEVVVLDPGTDEDPSVRVVRRYPVRLPEKDKLLTIVPDWSGRIWFASRGGIAGTVDPATGGVRTVSLGGTIDNALSADAQGAVFAVTTGGLYRMTAGADGTPAVSWQEFYPNTGAVTPPQATAGTGTSPTLLDTSAGRFVAIADNADPLNVRVYRRDATVPGSGTRLVCSVPVFPQGRSATATSMIGAGNSLVITNQYGYHGPGQTLEGLGDIVLGRLSEPGMTRIDIDTDGNGCRKVWTSNVRISSGVPKLSVATGLIYGSERQVGEPVQDVWYINAVDWRTGRIVWKKQYGSGLTANPNYSSIGLGPDGSLYVGALIGFFRVSDGA